MGLWLCLLTHLPKAAGCSVPPSVLMTSAGWEKGRALLSPAQALGGVEWRQGPSVTHLSCPSGLQHNRIWEVGADTFSQLSSLRTL